MNVLAAAEPIASFEVSPRIEPAKPADVRRFAWAVLLVLAGLQAWMSRFYITPDGVSYLDLSDAVVHGNVGELLNGYWSPVYPALLGVFRLALRSNAYWEFAVAHLLNFVLFITSLAGFEYFLSGLKSRLDDPARRALSSTGGSIAAYSLFGVLSLTMTPLSLPTPDLLVSAASFFVFGALLRLASPADLSRAALVLGVALAVGSLAKSFIIPWAFVCLIVGLIATRTQRGRPMVLSASIWLAAVLPWSTALSLKLGHVTFGDTGRLTYTWYVNQVESPSDVIMPHATATPTTDSLLPGVAITPGATGTDPIWYDPTRWYGNIHPHFDPAVQVRVFSFLVSQYVTSLAPIFLVLWFAFAVARRADRSAWWSVAWVVIVPCVAAIGAYSMVLITARYVAPFYVAIALVVVAGLRWPGRLSPPQVLLGMGIPFALMVVAPRGSSSVSLMNTAMAAVLIAWLARGMRPALMLAVALLGAAVVRVAQPGSEALFVNLTSLLLVLSAWLTARRAVVSDEAPRFSSFLRRGMLAGCSALLLLVAGLKYRRSLDYPQLSPTEPNDRWVETSHVRNAGIVPGERIALVGSPFEAYWARTAGVSIVAVVPPSGMSGFQVLPTAKKERLLEEFARAGANRIIVQQPDNPSPADSSWRPIAYVGWVRRLAPK